jgi:radical SAM protein with 4Fe4S-binding SPASM domain
MVSEGLGSVTVSLDGLRGSHDWFRGSAGSFDRACDVIGRAAGYGSLVMDVVTCVNRRNLDELDDIRGLLRDMGVARWRIFTVFPRGRATEVPELFLDGSQFGQVLDFIAACRREPGMDVAYGCEGFLGRWEGEARNGFFDCRAGVSIGSVLADGSISACPSLRGDFIQGNIYTDEFMAVWNGRFGVMRRRDWMKSGGCASCRLWKWCTGGAMHLRDEKTGETLLCHPKWLGELR